ncbi:unnamed protein product [Musa textilis]
MSGHVFLDFIDLLNIRPSGIMVFSTSIISCSRKHSSNSGISQTEENGSLGREASHANPQGPASHHFYYPYQVEKVMKSEVIKELYLVELEVEDMLYLHAGHAGTRGSSGGRDLFQE